VESFIEQPEPDPDQRPSSGGAEPTPEPATTPFEPGLLGNFTEDMDLFLDEHSLSRPLSFPPSQDPLLDNTWPMLLDDISNLMSNAMSEPILETIIASLHSLHTTLLQTEPTHDGVFDLSLARRVSPPANRALLVASYFQHTHREFPLTYRPSFNLATVPPGLLLAFLLCGSMSMTPAMRARGLTSTSRMFMRLAEEFVFRELEQKMALVGEDGKALEGMELYEALQAALLVHCTQFSLQNEGPLRRGRTVRLPVLVGACKDAGVDEGEAYGGGRAGVGGVCEAGDQAQVRFYFPFILKVSRADRGHMQNRGLGSPCRLAAERHVSTPAADDGVGAHWGFSVSSLAVGSRECGKFQCCHCDLRLVCVEANMLNQTSHRVSHERCGMVGARQVSTVSSHGLRFALSHFCYPLHH
jgi:hypothetical protein